MIISIGSLSDKVRELSVSAQHLSSEIACASQDIKAQANRIAGLTRGSRSGEEATNMIRESAKSLAEVASAISLVMGYCDDYLRNVEG